jgi:hypothetical protein
MGRKALFQNLEIWIFRYTHQIETETYRLKLHLFSWQDFIYIL